MINEKLLKDSKELAKKSSEVILATDPDREGEAIAWHVAHIVSEVKAKKQKLRKTQSQLLSKESFFMRLLKMQLKKLWAILDSLI